MATELETSKILDALKKAQLLPATAIIKPFENPTKDPNGDQKAVGIPLAVLPNDIGLKSLKPFFDEWRTKPERKKGNADMETADSFIDFTKRNTDPNNTVLFAGIDFSEAIPSATISAVFDYHPPGGDIEKAEHGAFTARYDFPISQEFKAWFAKSGDAMKQGDFSQFLNDHIQDLAPADKSITANLENVNPTFADPAQIFELSFGLDINAKKKYCQHQKFMSGESNLQFKEEHEGPAGTPLKVPGWFKINIPIFESGKFYALPVRLRYAIVEDRLHWQFDLWQAKEMFKAAFLEEITKIQTATQVPLYRGAP